MASDIESATIRRIYRRIVPFIILLYLVIFMDRIAIGFAALQMNKDLGFSPAVFGFGAGIFFLGYFMCEVPSNLALVRFGPRLWIARIMLSWGLISGCMALVGGRNSFVVVRYLQGAAEAGFFPGIIFYLSLWFPARYRAGVVAFFMAAAPLASIVGSPLAGSVLGLDGLLGLRGWQWMFVGEAVLGVVLSVCVLIWFTDRPEKAAWLAPDQRAWLIATMDAERAGRAAQKRQSVWMGLSDPRVLTLALVYFGTSAGLYTLGIWAPQIIRQFGLSAQMIGFVNTIPPIAAVVAMVLWARHSDRTGERTWHVVCACVLAAAGLLFAGFSTTLLAVLAALALVNMGITSAKPPLWSMPTLFLSGPAAAAGLAVINSVGNLGGFVGPYVIGWIKGETGSFLGGLAFVAGLLAMSSTLVLILAYTARRPPPQAAPR